MFKHLKLFILALIIISCNNKQAINPGCIKISENKRFFTTSNGDPFFWLGDTGWLLFKKLNREDADKYLSDRAAKGFNVIQVMVIHDIDDAVNVYGDSAIANKDLSKPLVTEGNLLADSLQYDFCDHCDYIIDLAASKGIYIAMVPVWGSNVKGGKVTQEQANAYAYWLALRYKGKPNILWLNGGDIKGSDSIEIWKTIGNSINVTDSNHIITFHPRGRTQSSTWFHNESWLDFNMFQSGHRNYVQDTSVNDLRFGEDNWKYVNVDYNLQPIKPTFDGEPSYEDIPQGLHDTTEVRWKDKIFAGMHTGRYLLEAVGFTYGQNSVMQFTKASDKKISYGGRKLWENGLDDPGASQVVHLKNLVLSRPYFERIPDQSLVANQGEKYNYLVATRGNTYAFIYTYTGREMKLNMGKIEGSKVKASWYNPRNGKTKGVGIFENKGTLSFNPPGEEMEGNDWVLVLDTK